MNFDVSSRVPRPRALAALALMGIAGACTYDFAQFEGLAPPLVDDAGTAGRGGKAGGDASAPDTSTGKDGSAGSAGTGRGGAGSGGTSGAAGTGAGAGGATAGTGGGAGSAGGGGAGASGGTTGTGGAAGSGGQSGSGGSTGKADASTDGPGGTGGATGSGGTGGATGGTGGSTGGSGGASGGTGGATGGSGGGSGGSGGTGGTAGSGGSGGSSNPDASDVVSLPDVTADRRQDVVPDVAFDCASVGGKTYQGHCYYARSVAVDWNTANTTTCEAPAHLVTITSAGEQNIVASLLTNQDRWIGLRRPVNSPKAESSFYWVTNETLSYRNWDVYSDADWEPNYTGECVRMRFTSAWADVVCTEALAVICERD